MRFGLLTDLQGISLDENSNVAKLHAMPMNKIIEHPMYGKLEFTQRRIQRFADSVNNRVRGVIPDVDFDHKRFRADAAGWVEGAEVKSDGLWLNVELTDEAKEAIKSKRYRYFSPELTDTWKDPETGREYEDVLVGGAFTNRPFLKRLTPLSLGDGVVGMVLSDDAEFAEQKGNDVAFFESVRNVLGLSESATEDDVAKKLSEQIQKVPDTPAPTPPTAPVVDVPPGTPKGMETLVKTFNERFAELQTKLDEEQKARRFAEAINRQFDDMKALLEQTDEARRKAEVEAQTKSLTEGKKYALPIPAQNKLRGMLLSESVDSSEVMKLFAEVLETGLVPLSEKGATDSATANTPATNDPVKLFVEKVNKKVEEDKLSDAAAMNAVALAEPDLYKRYRNASFIEGEIR